MGNMLTAKHCADLFTKSNCTQKRNVVFIDTLQHIFIPPLIELIEAYNKYEIYKCPEHGYHLSSHCLHQKCLNLRSWKKSHSYVLDPARKFETLLCTQCNNLRIVVNSLEDKEYVREVNTNVYHRLGSPAREYFLHTRCTKCDGQRDTLYGGMHQGGMKWLQSDKEISVNVACYDERWYLTFSNCIRSDL